MASEPNTAPGLRHQLIAATVGRMVINTAQRMFYPFLPAISRGLAVPPETITNMLSLRSALGMSAPMFGTLVDRFGKRNAMLLGLSVFCLGLTLVAIAPSVWGVFAAMMLIIVCNLIYVPALQAYLSERTPYARRGLAIALSELGWSGAYLIGVPVVGVLIARGDWRSPFIPIAIAGLAAGLWIRLTIPADAPAAGHAEANRLTPWSAILRNPILLAALGTGLLISASNECLSVVYGRWLEGSFKLSVEQLGLTVVVIAVSELIGEGGVALLSDRLGKRRTLALGLVVSAGAYFVLPLTSFGLQWALAGIFAAYLAFEFAIVASLPLISELLPQSRNRVMSAAIASHAAGRMIGAQLGGFVFQYGFLWNGVAAGILTALGIPLILWVVRERR